MLNVIKSHLTIERQLGYLIIVSIALSDLLFDTGRNLAMLGAVVAMMITFFAPMLLKPLTDFIHKVSSVLAILSRYIVFGLVYFGPISFVALVRLLKRRAAKKKTRQSQWKHQTVKANENFFEDMF